MIEVTTHLLDVGANNADVEIAEIIAAENETITILEVGYKFGAAGHVEAFVRNERVDHVENLAAPDVDHRVVRNIVLQGGDFYKMTGTDTSGGANVMGFIVVKDRVTK